MRLLIAAVIPMVLVFAAGCHIIGTHQPNNPIQTDERPASVDKLVAYLNRNAELLGANEALSCVNVDIDVKGEAGQVTLSGKMICQKPRNFRLTGVVLSKPEVDIGSNRDEFWYWIARNQPPHLYHCSYDALARGARIPFPFQPDMVVTALGLADYDKTKNFELKIVDDKKGHKAYELIEQAMSPQKQPIKKITVFDFHEARLPQPQVMAHVLKDDKGGVICVAEVRKVQRVGDKGAIVPKDVVFNWPSQKLQMTMHLHNPQIVSMTEEKAARVFTRRDLTYSSFDLASGRLDAELQRAGASAPLSPR